MTSATEGRPNQSRDRTRTRTQTYPNGYVDAARLLLAELKGSRLEVALIAGRRMAVSRNAEWYSELCRAYVRPRRRYPKLRTIIKRRHTATRLERIISGRLDSETEYYKRLEPFLEAYSNGRPV